MVKQIKNLETGFSFLIVGPGNEHVCFSSREASGELRITNYELKMSEQNIISIVSGGIMTKGVVCVKVQNKKDFDKMKPQTIKKYEIIFDKKKNEYISLLTE